MRHNTKDWALDETALEIVKAGNVDDIRAAFGVTASQKGRTAGNIAVFPIFGMIFNRLDFFGELMGGFSIERFRESFRVAVDDPDVDSIILNIDSPGGEVSGVREIAAEIRAARSSKPIIAYANTLAASAAYWIGSQATEFYATPSGEVGSIGVYTIHQDFSKALEEDGVKVDVIKAGEFKAEGNPYEALSDEGRTAIQARVDAHYDAFITDVAKGRGTSKSNVKSSYGKGRTLLAVEAKAAGMIDGIRGFDAVLHRATTAKIKAEMIEPSIQADVKSITTSRILSNELKRFKLPF